MTRARDGGSLIRVYTQLRRQRHVAMLTQAELAEELGVSRQTINAVERNRAAPSLALALAWSRRFDLPVERLFGPNGRASAYSTVLTDR